MMHIFENLACAMIKTKWSAVRIYFVFIGFVLLFFAFRKILEIDFLERQINPDKTISLGKMKFLFFTKANNNGYFHKKVIAMELIEYFLIFCLLAVMILDFCFDATWTEIVSAICALTVCIFADIVKEICNKLERQLRRLMLNDKL